MKIEDPLYKCMPGEDEEQEGDDEVGDDDVDPDVEGERVHEGEQLGRLLLWLSIKDKDENQDPVKRRKVDFLGRS